MTKDTKESLNSWPKKEKESLNPDPKKALILKHPPPPKKREKALTKLRGDCLTLGANSINNTSTKKNLILTPQKMKALTKLCGDCKDYIRVLLSFDPTITTAKIIYI